MAPAGYGDRVEGLHAVAAAVTAGRVQKLWVDEGRQKRPDVAAVLDLIEPDRVTVVADIRSISETEAPQGLVAHCTPLAVASIDDISGEGAAIVVLDHIEDPHNVGAIARSALAAGVTGMVISSKRQAPLSATAFKSAAGALELLPVVVVGSIPESLSRLRSGGIWAVGLEVGTGTSLFDLEILTEPVAVVVGAEGAGLSVLARKRCDVLASIPMVGDVESLNVSVSAALACFEIMRVRRTSSDLPG
jgi:23S rRNA (guanosine2251-2'-O)-methyltransferase